MSNRSLIILAAILAVVLGVLLWLRIVMPGPLANENQICNADAKVCPDGTTLGRSGPNCEFPKCPEPQGSTQTPQAGESETVEARLGQSVTVLGETITPKKVLDDSRCPSDVQCIWAGTVRVEGTVLGGMGEGQLTFELDKESTTEVNSIKLVDVKPYPLSTHDIADSEYIFTFEVTRR